MASENAQKLYQPHTGLQQAHPCSSVCPRSDTQPGPGGAELPQVRERPMGLERGQPWASLFVSGCYLFRVIPNKGSSSGLGNIMFEGNVIFASLGGQSIYWWGLGFHNSDWQCALLQFHFHLKMWPDDFCQHCLPLGGIGIAALGPHSFLPTCCPYLQELVITFLPLLHLFPTRAYTHTFL